jgi:hypothetical protein
MSLQKVAANRENALRSTGPRTLTGKHASRRNALKHGVLAQEVLLASEGASDLVDLDRRLRAALHPADDLESLLVDRVVSCAWRLRRALQAESAELGRARGEILRSQDDDPSADLDESFDQMDRLTIRELAEAASWLQGGGAPFEDPADESDPLEGAFTQLAERDFPELIIDDNENSPGRQVRQHLLAVGWTCEQARAALLEVVTEEIHARRQEIQERARRAKEAKRLALRACLVPHAGSLDRLLRYEAALERSFYRALHELHRLQAARAGVPVPPPAALDVDVGVTTEP